MIGIYPLQYLVVPLERKASPCVAGAEIEEKLREMGREVLIRGDTLQREQCPQTAKIPLNVPSTFFHYGDRKNTPGREFRCSDKVHVVVQQLTSPSCVWQ